MRNEWAEDADSCQNGTTPQTNVRSVPRPPPAFPPLLAAPGQGRSGSEIKGIHEEQSAQMEAAWRVS